MFFSKKALSNLSVVFIAIFLAFIGIDFIFYEFSPSQGISTLPIYKKDSIQEQLNTSVRFIPRGYSEPHPITGFDIAKNVAPMIYKMPDGPFEIFSNDYGCFDRHTLAEVRRAKSYTYFAGDSFAWGYGNYDQNIPTTYEKISHQLTVKCGIPHSGQKHQYEKFQQIVKLIGKYPKRVILTFYENDVANDYAYPHTTVIEGYEVDIYSFNPSEFKLIPRDMLKIERSVRAAVQPENLNTKDKIATWLDKHSITWNLFKFAANKTQEVKNGNIYDIGEGVNFGKNGGYANADVSRKNRDAIDLWVGDAQRHGYELIFILIPPKIHHANTHFYDGLKESLSKKKIQYLDLTTSFYESKRGSEEFYWLNDSHLNNQGNMFVGNLIYEHFH